MRFETVSGDMEKHRRDFLYGFKNMGVIFRLRDRSVFSNDSLDYAICGMGTHSCLSPNDFLLDIKASMRSGTVSVRMNDVIGVKINGTAICYRYFRGDFIELNGFTDKEKDSYISALHESNRVLGVIDGREYPLEEIDFERHTYYAIEGETYRMSLKNDREYVTMDYSLYVLKDDAVSRINPYHKPFFQITAALSYYNEKNKAGGKRKKPVLLLNRKELNILRDWRNLNALAF